jgi:hypothetical protein
MKKLVVASTLVFFISLSVNAQDDDKQIDVKRNEVKLNALYMVLGAFEGTYECILNEESGVGVSLFLPIDKDINDDIKYYISPYYRLYFGKKYAAGFFLEGFGMLSSVERTQLEFDDFGSLVNDSKNVTDFALGIGFGGKWITKSGFIGELNLGFGRNLFNNDFGDEFVGKVGITVGYRF